MSSPERPSNGLAVVALVCGLLGIVGALTFASAGAFIGSIAVVLGFVARGHEDRRGMATAGVVVGAIAVVLGVVSVLVLNHPAPPA